MFRRILSDIQRIVLRKLLMIDAAFDLKDLRIPPAHHLEQLDGDSKGSITSALTISGGFVSIGIEEMHAM